MAATPEAGPRPAGRGRRAILAGAAVLVLVLTAIVAYHWGSAGSAGAAATTRPSPSPSPSKSPTVADIYAAVAPSVVLIEAVALPKSVTESTGTGVVVNADGSILTALHVVKGAADIKVTFADGTASAASVAAADPTMDIAILTPATLPSLVVPAVLGGSGRVAVGDSVVAIGNQLGLADTTTAGVVSGLGRRLDEGPQGASLTGLIQFDAAVNPGSSGGPLVNGKGETIGIVVALANPTSARTFIGIGFAVPIGAALGAGGPGQRQPQQ
jgi:S1-C subfamily serine protease